MDVTFSTAQVSSTWRQSGEWKEAILWQWDAMGSKNKHPEGGDKVERPRDAYFVWEKNGQKMDASVSQQTQALADGRLHLLSWVEDAVVQDSEYCCRVISKAGTKTSTSYITVEGSSYQDTWSKEFANWRSVVSKHDRMMESWKKTWESCNRKGAV